MSKIKLFCTFVNELNAQESGMICKYDFDKGTLSVRSEVREHDIEVPEDSVFSYILELDDENKVGGLSMNIKEIGIYKGYCICQTIKDTDSELNIRAKLKLIEEKTEAEIEREMEILKTKDPEFKDFRYALYYLPGQFPLFRVVKFSTEGGIYEAHCPICKTHIIDFKQTAVNVSEGKCPGCRIGWTASWFDPFAHITQKSKETPR